MIHWSKLLFVFLAFGLAAAAAQAEVFRYTDGKGHTLFTDRPLFSKKYKLVWRSSVGKVANYKRSKYKYSRKSGKRSSVDWSKNKKRYTPLIAKVAKKVRLSPELLHAVIQAESAYDPKAKSSAGAMGLMQLMPATAKRFGVENAWDPTQNLVGGATYLRELLDMFKNNLRLALAAYNAGEGAVKKYGNKIPPYPETRNYVRKVVEFYLDARKSRRS